MKQFSIFLSGVLASVLILGVLFYGLPDAKAEATKTSLPIAISTPSACDSSRSIQVNGTAVVNIIPDRVLIQLGVQSNGLTVGKVQQANTASINRVVEAAKVLGIDVKDIATDWY